MRHSRRLAITAVLAAIFAVFAAGSASSKTHSTKSSAATRNLSSVPTNFVSGSQSATLEGCRNDGNPVITLPNGSGQFICPNAAYTTGNLGKGWNELDLVPFRLTTVTGNSDPTNYNMIIAGDYQLNGFTGWDVISAPTIGAGSDASCTVSANAQDTGPGITGGADSTIYRVLTIHQAAGTTCVFDYYMRLALGAHTYPGSSLQAYIFTDSDFKGGKKTVPLPVNEIQPQELNKDMAATRDTNTPWSVTKSATPASLNFGNVCDGSFSNTAGVAVTITVTKLAAAPSGQVMLITHVYATNPSARTITVDVSDKMYEGTTQTVQVGTTADSGLVDVPANTNLLVLTDSQSVTSSATHFNDVATATYTDKVTGVPVPGTTTASAGADVSTGTNTNGSATTTDSESIIGSGLSFKTGLPSTLAGSFIAPSEAGAGVAYTAGTYTVGPVTWSSGSQSDSWATTFSKTVSLSPIQATSGTLSDTASLVGSDGFTASYGPLDVNIESSASTTLTINKTIPDVLQGAETQTFHFHVYNSSNTKVADASITFTAGQTSKHVDVSSLPPGNYTVKEDTETGWNAQSDQSADLTLPSHCSNSVTFNNTVKLANAKAVKVTDPASYQQGWTFTLHKPDSTTVDGVTDTNGNISFGDLTAEGSYSITETNQSGWTQKSAVGCSFTVNYPADAGKTFTCTITNQSRGTVKVIKQINGAPITGSQDFQFELRLGDQHTASTSALETLHANSTNGGAINFTTPLVPGTTYAICELLVASYNPTIMGYGPYNPTDQANYWCWNFSITVAQAANTPSVTFTVENDHPMSKALTIGYWKNWSGCKKSNGKQTDQLGLFLNGIQVGAYTFTNSLSDECKAVQTLSKDTFTGTNKASDPLFNMAAQLLAADLNVNAQAGVCSAAVSAINSAQTLLVKYGWNGNTYSPKLLASDATLANQLAATLDKYNNNQLC